MNQGYQATESNRKPQGQRSRGTRCLSIPRFSISAAELVHRDCSGRVGQRLAGVGGVINFVGSLILVRLMNPPAIVEVEISGQPGLELSSIFVGRADKCPRIALIIQSPRDQDPGNMPGRKTLFLHDKTSVSSV
jgi:hypothetical protein